MPVPTRPPLTKTSHNSRAVFLHAVGVEARARVAQRPNFRAISAIRSRILHRRGVEADFLRPGLDEPGGVLQRADAAADGQGHEDLLHDPGDQVGHDLAALVAGGDVVEDQLIGPVVLISPGLLDGVAGIDVVEELNAFDHAAAVDVQAGNDPFAQHRKTDGGVWLTRADPANRIHPDFREFSHRTLSLTRPVRSSWLSI